MFQIALSNTRPLCTQRGWVGGCPTLWISQRQVGCVTNNCVTMLILNISYVFRIGRKKNYFLCLTVEIVFGIATAFAPNVTWWIIFRFFVGLTIPAILHIPFVICQSTQTPYSFNVHLMTWNLRVLRGRQYAQRYFLIAGLEAVAPSKRTLVSFYSNMFYVVGLMGFSVLAYSTTQWRVIALSTSVPFVLYFLYIMYVCWGSQSSLRYYRLMGLHRIFIMW